MGTKRIGWEFWLFIAGAVISSIIAVLEANVILFLPIEINLYTASFFALSSLLPITALGFFWFDKKFNINYSKETGLKITEEPKKKRTRITYV